LRPLVLKLAEILNQEAKDLAAAGAPFIQFDEPAIGFGKTDVKLAVEAVNIASSGVKAKTAVYTYFGSANGWLAPLFKTKVDVIGVDVVSDPKMLGALKRVKVTKELGIGCLDARNTKLEQVKELHKVFDAVARIVPLDRVYVNPNSGLEFLPHTQAVAKVRRLVEAARAYKR
jgi:5-methyltetrahydropteroyltriglutamate--homocysteine methyltransferase